jgi:hypothetical protein
VSAPRNTVQSFVAKQCTTHAVVKHRADAGSDYSMGAV